MKHKILIVLIFLMLVATTSTAGPLCALAPPDHHPNRDENPTPYASQQMGAVNFYLCAKSGGCPPYSFFQNGTLGNAMASSGPGGFTIRYNRNFMNDLSQRFGTYAAIGVLAHELGHVIDFAKHPQQIPQADREAVADQYAGCAFAAAGLAENSLAGLAASLHAMGPSPGYPTPEQRVALVRQGYYGCLR